MAGYIDGEGCFHATERAEVSIKNTYPAALYQMQRVFGGKVRARRSAKAEHRPYFTYRIHGEPAKTLCRALLPYLLEKRYQARMFLSAWEYPNNSAARRAFRREITEAKRVVYSPAH